MIRNGLPEGQESLVGSGIQKVILCQNLPGQSGPDGGGEQGGIRLIAAQIQLPDRRGRILGK